LKIAYLINQYPAPPHTYIRREIAALRELGTNVTVFSIRRFVGQLITEADQQEADRTHVILDANWVLIIWLVLKTLLSSPHSVFKAMQVTLVDLGRGADRGRMRHFAYFVEACVLRHWLHESGVTHLHVHHGTNPAAVAMICRALGGPPWSFTPHGPEEFERGDGIALRKKIAAATFVVGISEFAIRQLRHWSDPIHWNKLKLVRCGLDQAFISIGTATPVPDVNRIVCVGRLCAVKMQHVLIEATAKLAARGVDVQVTLVGDGETHADLERQVDSLGLRSRIRFTGWADEQHVRDAILESRVMVLPSRAEGLPVVIMESFALGRPVISTTIAAIPELIEPGKSGWLVPPGDVDQLAAAIEQSLTLPTDTLTQMAAVGRQRVAELHDASKNAGALDSLFRLHGLP
jgi:colanic acid/amylovoran biosynthesis glycosyltransferase